MRNLKTDILERFPPIRGVGSIRLQASLSDKCEALVPNREPTKIRVIHHFACTGGSLISRAIEAQRNVRVLSEVEPFSDMVLRRKKRVFAPTDLIGLARGSTLGVQDRLVADGFLSSVECVANGMEAGGQVLVLREHSHSRHCTSQEALERPSMVSLLRERFSVTSLLTIRHPADSWLSLSRRGWLHFTPGTLDEYCKRYMHFLDELDGVDCIKYEDFVQSPEAVVRRCCEVLDLEWTAAWQSFLPAIRMTGDSGRSGHIIEARPRRRVPRRVREEFENSQSYVTLVERLGYSPQLD